MYINDLYGEINDGGCTEGSSGSTGQRYEKMTCYSYEDLVNGISDTTKHIPVDRNNEQTSNTIKSTWRQE
jgi:hypothetical protein